LLLLCFLLSQAIYPWYFSWSRSQWPRGLRRRSAAVRLLGSWVRIPPVVWMFVSCTVFVLSGRGLCDGPITRPEEPYRLWCVSECDQVKINNLDTCCEQAGRRGKDCEILLKPERWFPPFRLQVSDCNTFCNNNNNNNKYIIIT
jgi:hypothetical protein